MKQALLDLHLLLLQAEAYAEQLRWAWIKICEDYPEFKERIINDRIS